MRIPQKPPEWRKEFQKLKSPDETDRVFELTRKDPAARIYLHWDKLRRYPTPEGYSSTEWWIATKIRRTGTLKSIDLKDKIGNSFRFCVPDLVQAELHKIDTGAGGALKVPEPITNAQTRDQYLIRSLMEEAITSSQLEGAATTREVAKEMIRSGRNPRDKDEQMILNNYATMRRIADLKDQPLSPAMVFEIHKLITEKTLDNPSAAGRFRNADEKCVVGDDVGAVFHEPPPSTELPDRLQQMCDFANAKTPDFFVHPVVRAIILHFWLAYDHPFVDGNGRTARALFYWLMLREKYWLFEFISISHILRKAPIKYGRSFLYTETDDNDLTYFIVAQTKVIRQAIDALHAYIDHKTKEVQELESHLRVLNLFNHRQVLLIRHALKHPYQQYTIESHRSSHNIVYETARGDLMDLHERGVLQMHKSGRKMVFVPQPRLAETLRKLEKQTMP